MFPKYNGTTWAALSLPDLKKACRSRFIDEEGTQEQLVEALLDCEWRRELCKANPVIKPNYRTLTTLQLRRECAFRDIENRFNRSRTDLLSDLRKYQTEVADKLLGNYENMNIRDLHGLCWDLDLHEPGDEVKLRTMIMDYEKEQIMAANLPSNKHGIEFYDMFATLEALKFINKLKVRESLDSDLPALTESSTTPEHQVKALELDAYKVAMNTRWLVLNEGKVEYLSLEGKKELQDAIADIHPLAAIERLKGASGIRGDASSAADDLNGADIFDLSNAPPHDDMQQRGNVRDDIDMLEQSESGKEDKSEEWNGLT